MSEKYTPQVGDVVKVEGTVEHAYGDGSATVRYGTGPLRAFAVPAGHPVELVRRPVTLKSGDAVQGLTGTYLVGESAVYYTTLGGDVVRSGLDTPELLAERVSAEPDKYKVIRHERNI